MRPAIALVLASLVVVATSRSQQLAKSLERYHGMVERGYNRGPFIDSANRRYAFLEAPYCASGLSELFRRAEVVHPRIRSARARDFADPGCVTDAKDVFYGRKTVQPYSVAVFVREGGGHVCIVIKQVGDTLYTFEFNTSNGVRGSQWNGSWSGFRTRSVKKDCSPFNAFRITTFIEIHEKGGVHE